MHRYDRLLFAKAEAAEVAYGQELQMRDLGHERNESAGEALEVGQLMLMS